MPTKVVLDLDTGIDDALALCYVIGSPELELVGVTATFGNVSQDQSVANALAMLHLLGRDDIPVYPGALHPLKWNHPHPYSPAASIKAIHGPLGLGELELPLSPRPAEKLTAPSAINSLARQYSGKLALVATGPLTNLALALEQDPEGMAHLGALSIMGGAFKVPGNVTPYAEANIINDPEAASQVLSLPWCASQPQKSGSESHTTIVGLDVTMKTTLTRAQTAHWRQLNDVGALLASITDFYIEAYQRDNPSMDGCALHDPLAAAIIDHPNLIASELAPVSIVLEGPQRGQTLVNSDTSNSDTSSSAEKHLSVALDVKASEARTTIVTAIERCLANCL